MTDKTLLDPEAWNTIKSMADAQFLAELIDVFLTDTPELLRQMRAGLAAGDLDMVRRAAHTLKSNSASFGATQLTAASRELEQLAKNGTLEGGAARLAEIEARFAQLAPVLAGLKHER